MTDLERARGWIEDVQRHLEVKFLQHVRTYLIDAHAEALADERARAAKKADKKKAACIHREAEGGNSHVFKFAALTFEEIAVAIRAGDVAPKGAQP